MTCYDWFHNFIDTDLILWQCRSQGNWSQVRLPSLKLDELFPYFVPLEESVQLYRSQTDFFPTQKDIRTGDPNTLL